MTQIKCLTIPELKVLAQRHKLDTSGKKAQLLMRLSIWVRDEVARGTKHLLKGEASDGQCIEDSEAHEKDEDSSAHSIQLEGEGSSKDDDTSSSSEDELELTGGKSLNLQALMKPDDCNITARPLSRPIRTSSNDVLCSGEEDSCSDDDSFVSGHPSTSDQNNSIHSTLRKLFGFSKFRDGQEWAICRCLNEQRSLLVAPTGFGKSLCYALPAAVLSGVCIVVSPLLSLIHDQIRVLPARLPAATLSGPMTSASTASTLDDIIRGRIKVLFVSPERLTSASFRRLFRPKWNTETKVYERIFPTVSLFCVDEAHCLSQWAHNFRPSYLRLRSVLDMIEPKSILAITATAGPRVVRDICQMLSIVESDDVSSRIEPDKIKDAGVMVLTTDRDNIDVKCLYLDTQEQRLSKVFVYRKHAQLLNDIVKPI